MRHLARAFIIVAAAVPVAAIPALWAQSTTEQGTVPTPACALLSVAEIRVITGRADYPDAVEGDPEGEGAGGGSSCMYGGSTLMPGPYPPMLGFVLIRGKSWTERHRTTTLPPGCQRELVTGLGDEAYFEFCPASRSTRSPPLYVKVGTNDLIVQIDADPPLTLASARPIVIAVAKAAVLKLR